jgi:hypothetical protein
VSMAATIFLQALLPLSVPAVDLKLLWTEGVDKLVGIT